MKLLALGSIWASTLMRVNIPSGSKHRLTRYSNAQDIGFPLLDRVECGNPAQLVEKTLDA